MAASKKILQPWDRQIDKGESPEAYRVFWVFLELGLKRSLQSVVEESGRSLALIQKLSTNYKWAPRARAFDKHLLDIQMQVIESKTKSEAALWAKREAEYRHEAFEFSQKLKAKAEEMLDAPLYETVVDTFTEIIGVDGQPQQIPVKVIKRPVRWNFKDMIAMGEFMDKLRRLSLGVPTNRIAVEGAWIEDPNQRLIQAKVMMTNWIKNKLEGAVARVCNSNASANPVDVRTQLLAELPLWFAEDYSIADPSALIDALPIDLVDPSPIAPTPLLLDEFEGEKFEN